MRYFKLIILIDESGVKARLKTFQTLYEVDYK